MTFECVAARVVSGPSSCLVVAVYRTDTLTVEFYDELATLLDRLATFGDPLLLAGDVNIHMERPTEPHTVQFNDLLSSYGLIQRVRGVTHEDGGTIDVVCTRDDLPAPTVDVIDVGISNHCPLRWTSQLYRPQPV